jgi:ABC-type glycerol-3-phosphate transport system substrate-binding protein
VGVLFYRKDRVSHSPRSWADVLRQASRASAGGRTGLRFALTSPEDLTVVFLELAYAAGAHPIVTSDGRNANIDQPQMLEALNLMRDALRGRGTSAVPQAGRGAVSAYETGRVSFLRGWPFVATRIHRDARTAPKRRVAAHTKIVALPPWKPGGRRVGILDGHNLVIPRSAPNPSGALHLIDYLTSLKQVRKDAVEDSQIPVLKALGLDPAVQARATVRAVENTTVISPPAISQYAEVSKVISSGILTILRRTDERALAASELRVMNRRAQRTLDNGSP